MSRNRAGTATPPRRSDHASRSAPATLALVGNPNSGKTTVFNALTGLRQKVGNYPGVTVERKIGAVGLPDGSSLTILDLPGLYSLTPHSPDEVIAHDVLQGYRADTPRPDAIVNVVDASNLERNLYLTSQLLDLGLPTLIVLTMSDTARQRGVVVDAPALERALGVPVRAVIATRGEGLAELREALAALPALPPPPPRRWRLPALAEREVAELSGLLREHHDLAPATAFAEALALLSRVEDSRAASPGMSRWSPPVQEHVIRDFEILRAADLDLSTAVTEARYADVERAAGQALRRAADAPPVTVSDRLDRFFLHRFWGYAVFFALMYVVFQAMFSWASYPMDWIGAGVDAIGRLIAGHMSEGALRDLLVNGVVAGVGNTIVFLPQILLLFLFISLLEDTGYLARAAFLMDRLMSRVGLHGKSFIPLLSSYACAIPGIMATRTIESPRARLLTILVAPLMSCSARLPVYALMIGAFIPAIRVLGIFNLQALTLFGMYALGTAAAFGMAALFNRTLLRGEPPSFLLEMPPYRLPSIRTALLQMWERALLFLRRAGTVILALTVILWFLENYPKQPPGTAATEQLRHSFAGQMGRVIEPVIEPLGFDWKIGIGLITSFAAREVFVSAMGTVYAVDEKAPGEEEAAKEKERVTVTQGESAEKNVEKAAAAQSESVADDEERLTLLLGEKMKQDVNEQTGRPTFTPLVAVALMVYYVLAMQCMSTVAVVRRETNGWRWPLFQIAYMTALAWVVTFAVYQGGRALGWE